MSTRSADRHANIKFNSIPAKSSHTVSLCRKLSKRGQQALNVRAVGLMQTTDDIAATVVKVQNGTPVRVRDLGNVVQAPKVRLGQLGKTLRNEDGTVINNDDVVEGIVLLRKGAVA